MPLRDAFRRLWSSGRLGRVLSGAAIVVAVGGCATSPSPTPSPTLSPAPLPSRTTALTPEPTAIAAAWTATGNMIAARMDFTATLLPDGRVLVTGGYSGYNALPRALASAELYDPASGEWAATGSMRSGRYRHTATLLPDGKVLVAGGNVSSNEESGSGCCLATAELYDPANGTWAATGSMVAARVDHTATLMPDGRVLVEGGDSSSGTPAFSEVYDPPSGSWTSTGVMVLATYGRAAVLLHDGRVLVVGGNGGGVAELYNPSTERWTPAGGGGDGGPAVLLRDGRVLVAGGLPMGIEDPSRRVVLYEPARGTWRATASMQMPGGLQNATLLLDGDVIVMGGISGFGDAGDVLPATTELYDPISGSWRLTASLGKALSAFTVTTLPDGRVLVAGGYEFNGNGPLAAAQLYIPGIRS